MRCVIVLALAALIGVPQVMASDRVPDQHELAKLQAKAERATPRDRCILYAKLVSAMTDVTGKQLDSGKPSDVVSSLKAIQNYTAKIGRDITGHSKRLKDAQIMMRRTAFRLKELMKGGPMSEQPEFEATLKQMDQVQSQMMLAVFNK